jgi:hypothetical protein
VETETSAILPTLHRNRAQFNESIITTFAGTDWIFQSDGGPAVNAPLSQVDQLGLDPDGNILMANPGNHMVARLNRDGTLTVLAGNGIPGFSGNGELARNASLSGPSAAVMDTAGNLFIADQGNHCIRRVTRDGIISIYAGTAKREIAGDLRSSQQLPQRPKNRGPFARQRPLYWYRKCPKIPSSICTAIPIIPCSTARAKSLS